MIYFARAGLDGPVKIGLSEMPLARVATLRSASHENVVLLATMDGDVDVERALHDRFAHLRTKGEWFAATHELLSYIEALPPHTVDEAPPRVVPMGPRKPDRDCCLCHGTGDVPDDMTRPRMARELRKAGYSMRQIQRICGWKSVRSVQVAMEKKR